MKEHSHAWEMAHTQSQVVRENVIETWILWNCKCGAFKTTLNK